MIADLLDDLRAAIPECRLIALVDLDAVLVLAVSSAARLPQEMLDELAETAALIMPGPDDPLANPPFSSACPDQAVFHFPAGLLVIARSTTDLICCQCAPEVDVEAVLAGARNVLGRVNGAEATP